jgi:hypothetical protein
VLRLASSLAVKVQCGSEVSDLILLITQCDQRKPTCGTCQKGGRQCPGYRNLDDLVFRNESNKVIRKLRSRRVTDDEICRRQIVLDTSPQQIVDISAPQSSQRKIHDMALFATSHCLLEPLENLGAGFFFAKYSVKEEPFAGGYDAWLQSLYLENNSNNFLRPIIEAVGLAGLANISYAADVEAKSKERYCNALLGLKQALDDPAGVTEDATLMAVILFVLFEVGRTVTSPRWYVWSQC